MGKPVKQSQIEKDSIENKKEFLATKTVKILAEKESLLENDVLPDIPPAQ